MSKYFTLIVIGFAVILWGCSSDSQQVEIQEETAPVEEAPEVAISKEVVQGIINSIPSPLELTTVIKESGSSFSKNNLNDPDNIENYPTSYKKALNLGIYGADLGYINIYEKTHLAISYLSAVRDLSNDLKVGQFFDFGTLRRLASNSQNLDSLLYISTSGFEKMNNFLTENGRGNLGMLILVGGWLESLYIAALATEVDFGAEHQEAQSILFERVGEQKMILDDIQVVLSVYKKSPGIESLHAELAQLQEVYKKVNITYTYEEPETIEVDGMLQIIDKSSTNVEMSIEVKKEVLATVRKIRKNIIR